MAETDDGLKDYVLNRSPEAFRRLVDRYVGLVYAAARRQVRDPSLAEDVTQAVFMVLAEKADGLRADRPLSAWLLQVTRYAANNAKRSRARQAHHERKAAEMAAANRTTSDPSSEANWEEWSPLLDEGISRLRGRDRDAIVLRFFEHKSSREVADSLGISEAAAAKRLERAVAKLRDFFARRGATVSSTSLAVTLAARSTEAPPPHLAASIGTAAAAAGTSIAKGTLTAMACANAKAALLVATAAALFASVVIVESLPASRPAHASTPPTTTPVPSGVGAPAPLPSVPFSDGSTATLLAVTDDPKAGRWWAPDGAPLPAVPAEVPPFFLNVLVSKDSHAFYMVIRHEGPSLAGTYLVPGIPQIPPFGGFSLPRDVGPNVRAIAYSIAVPDKFPRVDLLLNFASGPWTLDERYPLPAAAAVPNPSIKILSVADDHGSVTVSVARLRPSLVDGEDRILLVSADGREHSSDRVSPTVPDADSPVGIVYRFPVPVGQAVALVHRWRPFETREIRNISLSPGTKTNVTTELRPVPERRPHLAPQVHVPNRHKQPPER